MELDNHHLDGGFGTDAGPIAHHIHQRIALYAATLRGLCSRPASHVLRALLLEVAGPRALLCVAERGSH